MPFFLPVGMLSRLFASKDDLMSASLSMANLIASKSPVAVQGTKVNLNYSRDHTVDESLDFMVIKLILFIIRYVS